MSEKFRFIVDSKGTTEVQVNNPVLRLGEVIMPLADTALTADQIGDAIAREKQNLSFLR